MNIRSILKPDQSVMAAIGVIGIVYATYQLSVGTVADAHVTPANHPALESGKKKAGYTAFIVVSALSLITRDGNIAILGYGTIIAEEIHYRHAIMAEPSTGEIVAPNPDAYRPAGGHGSAQVIPIASGE